MSHLAIRHLSVENSQGLRLVDDISLTLQPGKILALVGQSGSGKSLTCGAALNTLPPGTGRVSGELAYDGKLIPIDHVAGKTFATILQNPRTAFNPLLSIKAHLHETLRAHGSRLKPHSPKVLQVLSDVGLNPPQQLLNRYPFQMSGGMLQRLMIALAILTNAPFLIADEPTTDLDLVLQRRILDQLKKLVKQHQLGMLLVTHDFSVVAYMADQVAVIDQGKVVEQGDTDSLFRQPTHPVTQHLLAAHFALYNFRSDK